MQQNKKSAGSESISPRKSKASRPRRSIGRKALPWIGAAAALGGLALVNNARARKAKRDNPPIGMFVHVDGVRLHYLEKGTGAPILLVHGNGVMMQDWIISGLFDELAKTNRVIAVDRPGFGYSSRPRGTRWTPERQAELLVRFLERMDAVPAKVVGHSFGALTVAAMAVNHPAALSGVALLGGYYYPNPRADVLIVSGSAVPGYGDVLNHTFMPLAGEAMQKAVNRKIFGPAETPEAWTRDFPWGLSLRPSRMRAGASDAVHMISSAARLHDSYSKIEVPVSIVAGTDDRLVDTPSQTERLHAAVPHSRLTLVEGVGHMVHHNAMDAVAAAIRAA